MGMWRFLLVWGGGGRRVGGGDEGDGFLGMGGFGSTLVIARRWVGA